MKGSKNPPVKSVNRILYDFDAVKNIARHILKTLAISRFFSHHYETFIGHELTDAKPSIVHRFIIAKIKFPDIAAGFILSRNLVSAITEKLEEVKVNNFKFLGQDSPSSTIPVFSTSRVFHWKSDCQRLR